MHRIRVLFANAPEERITALTRILQTQPDIELVGREPDLLGCLIEVGNTEADVVIVAGSGSAEAPPSVDHLLMEYPNLLVVAIGSGDFGSCTYRLQVQRMPLPDERDDTILKAIRSCS